jgi:hypothetical protein
VYLAESNQPPFDKLEPLAVLKTNPDGAGIVQAIGVVSDSGANAGAPSQRFLIVTEIEGSVASGAAPTIINKFACAVKRNLLYENRRELIASPSKPLQGGEQLLTQRRHSAARRVR